MRKGLLLTCLAGVFASYMLSSCSGVFSNYTSLFSSLPDTDAGRPAIPSDRFFYVKISDATFRGSQGYDLLDYVMYEKENGPGYDCKIPKGEESTTEDLYCMFEVLEGDLFLHEIEFEYNVPEGMCDYFTFQTHWHYNQKAGYGPKEVYKRTKYKEPETRFCKTSVPSGTECPKDCQVSRSQSIDAERILWPIQNFCSERDGFHYCLNNTDNDCEELLANLCQFNDTENENENCCIGEVLVHDRTKEEVTEPGESSWGGDLRQCIGGLGRIAWDNYTADGLPIFLITKSDSGIRNKYPIPALIDVLQVKNKIISFKDRRPQPVTKHRRNSFVIANHWEGIEDKTNLPKFYKSVNDDVPQHHAAINDGYPYITLGCEDKGREVKHRIHLIIREWNSQEEFLEFKSGGTGDPDVAEKEGSDCDYYEQEDDNIDDYYRGGEAAGGACNDMVDADDWVATAEDTEETHPNLEYR